MTQEKETIYPWELLLVGDNPIDPDNFALQGHEFLLIIQLCLRISAETLSSHSLWFMNIFFVNLNNYTIKKS